MAGKNQHHIWQMIQRGFTHDFHGYPQILTFSKNGKIERTQTKKFGYEEYFYGDPDGVVDRKITEIEGKLNSPIQEWRGLEEGVALNSDLAVEFVLLTELRSKYLRESVVDQIDRLSVAVTNKFTEKVTIENFAKEYLANNIDEFRAKFKEAGYPDDAWDFLEAAGIDVPAELFSQISGALSQVSSDFRDSMSKISEISGPAIKKAQLGILENDFLSIERADNLRKFSFTVIKSDCDGFILPDTGVAFLGGKKIAPFWTNSMNFSEVILPISASTAVYGFRKDPSQRSIVSINRILSGCAYEKFVAKAEDPNSCSLIRWIGKHAKILSRSEESKIIREATTH